MLKIPSAADVTPPLMAPLRTVEEERFSPEEMEEIEQASRIEESSSPWLLVGGGFVIAGLFAVGAMVFLAGKRTAVHPALTSPITAIPETTAPKLHKLEDRGEAALTTALKPLAVKFLEATTVAQWLSLVRNPEAVESKIRAFYPDGRIEPLGLGEFNMGDAMAVQDPWVTVTLRTGKQEARSMAFVMTPDGFKIDWESWAGWSEMTWDKFLETRPAVPQRFRVNVFPTDYYNFAFSDDLKWQSYRLESTDGEHSIYGYVEKGSELAKQIHLDKDAKQIPMILSLKFPEGGTSNGQVVIDKFIADGWVEKEVQ